ncbi:10050_t:CDS:2 [Cetraspora pellucida]|uniref:10050_t:CDS:1 n=1 Tax=Cetraspora pellucida TaxID=1433469 RepID=A0A9N9HNL4_9GLOM|nr:10050_t:CDS:2 [Cetraspora pellucida]
MHNENTHDLEPGEPICDLEFNKPTCNYEIAVQDNKDVRLGCSKERLYEGRVFQNWEEAVDTLTLYSQHEGFKLRKGCIEKASNRTIRKRTMLCEHRDEYKPRNIQLTKETSTKYIKCPWHVNLSQPQKNNPNGNVYLTTLNNDHNHSLSPYRTKFFNDSELTQEMHERIEFYVSAIKLKPLQIQRALQREFPDHKIYLSEIHKATAKYYSEKRKEILNDAASLYEELVKKKNDDPRCLLELGEALDASIEEESKKAKYAYWKTQIPLIPSTTTLPQALFPELDKALSLFITPEIQKIQRTEIKSCINYHVSAITKDEMIKYQEPESDNTLFVEDNEDIMQISINYILENIDINEIEEIWAIHGIARNIIQKAVQFHRQDVLEKLQNLLTEIQENELVNSPANDDNDETCSNSLDSKSLDDDEECEESNSLANIPLQNPKKHKSKGCPKSSKRIKRSEELKPAKRRNQCGNCGEYRHYKPKCSKK